MMHADSARKAIRQALEDEAAAEARGQLCRALAKAFRGAGQVLWAGGSIIGGDRVECRSPFRFGSDATVGLGTVAQIAGELTAGAVLLLEHDNTYAAAALVRQLVEVEYLAWAFAEEEEEAERWLRSSAQERMEMWQPRHLRKRSEGRFRGEDYSRHCENGGHPTPQAMSLLPDHKADAAHALWWFDTAAHGASIWEYATVAAEKQGWVDHVREAADSQAVTEAIQQWRERDGLVEAIAEVRQLPAGGSSTGITAPPG